MSLNSIFIRPLIKFEGEEQDQTQTLAYVCECKIVRVSTGQFEESHVGNEGNLEGCYWNESEERPILRAINIETNSAESDKCSLDQIEASRFSES